MKLILTEGVKIGGGRGSVALYASYEPSNSDWTALEQVNSSSLLDSHSEVTHVLSADSSKVAITISILPKKKKNGLALCLSHKHKLSFPAHVIVPLIGVKSNQLHQQRC